MGCLKYLLFSRKRVWQIRDWPTEIKLDEYDYQTTNWIFTDYSRIILEYLFSNPCLSFDRIKYLQRCSTCNSIYLKIRNFAVEFYNVSTSFWLKYSHSYNISSLLPHYSLEISPHSYGHVVEPDSNMIIFSFQLVYIMYICMYIRLNSKV